MIIRCKVNLYKAYAAVLRPSRSPLLLYVVRCWQARRLYRQLDLRRRFPFRPNRALWRRLCNTQRRIWKRRLSTSEEYSKLKPPQRSEHQFPQPTRQSKHPGNRPNHDHNQDSIGPFASARIGSREASGEVAAGRLPNGHEPANLPINEALPSENAYGCNGVDLEKRQLQIKSINNVVVRH